MNNKHYLPLALLVTALTVLTNAWLSTPPELTPASAPKTDFSGARAMNLLEEFLQEGVAHPIGSVENRRVKHRIQKWLDAEGLEHQEQRAWGCNKKSGLRCGFVENIVATIPGREPGPYVALMAHYDSVPASPGAGDDMAGVVAVLETARAIKAAGRTRNPVILIITDGEESGLLGADAFFSQHPLAQQIAVILNAEGSGTRGASAVLRTSSPDRWFMERLGEIIDQPKGSSFAAEVFKRMPNDTDFSVSTAAGVPGVEFVFAKERVHYHTPKDRPDLLDPRTVEQHGQNLHPLALALANSALPTGPVPGAEGDVVFQDLFGAWIQWPAKYSWLFLALASALLLADSLRLHDQKLLFFFAATLIPALALSAAMGAGYAISLALEDYNGITVEWPAQLWAFRLAIGAGAVFASCLFAAIIQVRFPAPILLLGTWWFVAILVLLLLLLVSEAASVYLTMLLPAALLLYLSNISLMPDPLRRLCRVATLIPAVTLLNAAQQAEEALGYVLVLAPLTFLGLYLALASPFFRGSGLFLLSIVSGLAMLVGGIAATSLPLYSEYRPQHVSVRHYEDADARRAHWRIVTDGAVPGPLAAILDIENSGVQLYPWSRDRVGMLSEAGYEELAAPQLELVQSKPLAKGREVVLRIASQRDAWMMGLFVPGEANLQSLRVGERDIPLDHGNTETDFLPLYFYGTQNQDALLRFVIDATEPIQAYLADYATELPTQGVINARPREAVPVHSGDLSVVWQRVSF